MTIDIKVLTEQLHNNCVELEKPKQAKLEDILGIGNSFVELMSIYIEQYSKENEDLLTTVLDELFVDLHISVILAAGGHFKSSCVIIRTVTELSLYLIYFLDHPIEVRMWGNSGDKNTDYDMSFSQTLEKVANVDYLFSASQREVNKNEVNKARTDLQNCYRELSERVHGKFLFLQQVASNDEALFNNYCKVTSLAFKAILRIAIARSDRNTNVFEKIPSLKKIL